MILGNVVPGSSGVIGAAAHNTAAQYHNLWFFVYLPVLGAAFLVFYVAILFAALRYRNGRRTRLVDGFPEQREEKAIVETLYAVGLLCIVGVLYYFLFVTETRIDAVSKHQALTVNVIGFQWQWRFVYPATNTVINGSRTGTPGAPRTLAPVGWHYPTLVVPAGEVVRFNVTSRDVIHSFWLPFMRFKRDANPNMINVFDLQFPKPGFYPGRCAEFCGLYHTLMRFYVRVLPRARFDAWLKAHAGKTL